MEAQTSSVNFPRVVIIGGGFGGIELAKKLEEKEVRILMLDRHNYHTFQPLLYQVATGGLEADSIAFPLRKIFKGQKNFTFRNAEATQIVHKRKIVETTIGEIPYDYLIIATGSDTNFFGQKQLRHYAMPMKTIPEALNLRSMILQNLEEAQIEHDPVKKVGLLNFVVVGGGPTGVELSGALAELKRHVLKNDYPVLNNEKTEPLNYFDKGSMATVGRNRAVVDMGKIRFQGFFAWFVWMLVHLLSLLGFRNKLVVFVNWIWSYFSYDRGTRLIIRKFNRKRMTEDTVQK